MTWSSDLLQLANIKTLLRQAINGKSPGALDENDSFRDYVDAVDNIPTGSGEGGHIGCFANKYSVVDGSSGLTIMADGTTYGFNGNTYQLYQYFKEVGINPTLVKDIDLTVRFRFTSVPSGTQDIFGIANLLTPDVDGDLKVKLWSNAGSSYEYESPAITLDQWVIFKCHVDLDGSTSGSTCVYTPSISLDDGTTWTDGTPFTDTSVNLTSFRRPAESTFMFGNMPNGSYQYEGNGRAFTSGEIDIYNSELKVNGKVIYGTTGKKIVEGDVKLSRQGYLTVQDGIATIFSSSSYLRANRSDLPSESTVNTIEMVCKFSLDNLSGTQNPMNFDQVFTCDVTSSGLSVWDYSAGSRKGYYGTFDVTRPYYVKCYIDWATKTKTISMSEDGETWTELVSFVDSGMNYSSATYIFFGNRAGGDRPLYGCLDTSESYIKINDVLQIGYKEV